MSSLQKATSIILRKRLDKIEQCSEWNVKPFRNSQLEYASLDATISPCFWIRYWTTMLWPQKKDDDSSYIQIKVCTLPIHYSMSKKRVILPIRGSRNCGRVEYHWHNKNENDLVNVVLDMVDLSESTTDDVSKRGYYCKSARTLCSCFSAPNVEWIVNSVRWQSKSN